jgi:uncharacterized membrane protein YkvA (DUF1232 family)
MTRLAGTVARLPRYLKLARELVRDPSISRARKAGLAAGIGYAVLPVGLIPGVIPVVGQLDDLAALLLGLRQALRGCSDEVAGAHLAAAGLSQTALDADLETVRDAAVWLARRAATVGGRALAAGGRLAARLAGAAPRRAPAPAPPSPRHDA